MGNNFPQELIEEIKARVSIKEVVADYLSLSKDGANWKALCPFHKEKTPSFKVHEGKGIFHCFGCGESGNIFTFLMKMEGVSFPEAVERLAKRAGVELPRFGAQSGAKQEEENAHLYRVNELAERFYKENLFSSSGEKALQYLKSRGLNEKEIEKFSLGYAPSGWENLLKLLNGRGIPEKWALEVGLILPRESPVPGQEGYYDRFRERIIFPIKDLLGRTRGFGARVLDDSLPKYINSPESPIYKKGDWLYGLESAKDAIRKKDQAIIVEGYFDQISLAINGFEETVASLGTAFTESQARLVARYTKRVFLIFDADTAGRKASFRALSVFLSSGLFPFLVLMPEGFDPDELVRKEGREAFQGLLEKAPRLLNYYMEFEMSSAGADLNRKGDALRALCQKLALIPQGMERELYLKRLSELSGVSLQRLERTMLRERIPAKIEENIETRAKNGDFIGLLSAEALILSILVNNPNPVLAKKLIDAEIFNKLTDEHLSLYISELCKEIMSRGHADPVGYMHFLVGTQWEKIIGRALNESSVYQGDKSLSAIRDALYLLEKRGVEEKDQELTRRLNQAKLNGNEQLISELLQKKQELMEHRKKLGSGKAI